MTSKELVSLQFSFGDDYEVNLSNLIDLIKKTPKDAIVVAPELCLTNFAFADLDKAHSFSKEAINKLFTILEDRIFCFSLIEKRGEKFYNCAKILHQGKVIHSQDKVKLFKFGEEDRYYSGGDEEKVKIVEIDGLRFAILICFEIRFIELWQMIQGADIIMIPALWGILRKDQLESITKAMAIINQAFVILSNSSQDDMAKSSGIITPFGKEHRDDESKLINLKADLSDIKKMRRYMDIGLK
jgi:predicted amidohydrolase